MADLVIPSLASRWMPGKSALLAAVSMSAMLAGGCADMGGSNFLALAPQDEAAHQAEGAPRSIPELKAQFDSAPGNPRAAIPYAMALKKMGSKTEAYAALRTAAQANGGTDKALLSEYGRLALELGDMGVAKEALAKADDPGAPDWRVVMARGTVLAKEGQYQMALPFFERAYALEPKHPSVLSNLALAYTMTGQAEKGEPLLRDAIASGSTDPRVKQNLALVLKVQGKTGAEAPIATATVNAPKAPEAPVIKTTAAVSAVPAAPPAKPVPLASTITTSSIGRLSTGEAVPLPPIPMSGDEVVDYSTDSSE